MAGSILELTTSNFRFTRQLKERRVFYRRKDRVMRKVNVGTIGHVDHGPVVDGKNKLHLAIVLANINL